jgi:hypothetical protein
MTNRRRKMNKRIILLTAILLSSTICQDELVDWEKSGFDDTNWKNVQVVGPLGTAPWTNLTATGPAAGLPDNAQWIWEPDVTPTSNITDGTWYFRKGFTLPADKEIQSAELIMSADNIFTAWVNGTEVGTDDTWEDFAVFQVNSGVQSGTNILAVSVINTIPGPAGLIGSLVVTFTDGTTLEISTGSGWKAIPVEVTPDIDSNWIGDDPHCNEADLTPLRGADPYIPRLLDPPLHDLPADPKPLPVHKGVNLEVWHRKGDNFHVGGMALLENGDMLELDYDGKLYHVTGLDSAHTVARRELPSSRHPEGLGLYIRNNEEVFVVDNNSVWTYRFDGSSLTGEKELLRIPKRPGWYRWNCDFVSDGEYLYTGLNTRGDVSRYHFESGTWEHDFAVNMRNNNGMGMNESGDIWFSDNQGNYRPGSPIFLLKQGKSYGVPTNGISNGASTWQSTLGPEPDLEPYKNDMIWIPNNFMSNSSTDIHFMQSEPFKGQALVGDNRTGHLNRLIIEEVDGQKQGAIIRMTGGLEGPNYRIVEDDKGNYYLGGLGTGTAYWSWCNKLYGFQKMTFKDGFIGSPDYNDVFNVSLVRDGIVIGFTSDISDDYLSPDNFMASVFNYIKSVSGYYGGPKKDSVEVNILGIEKLSRRDILITLDGLLKESIIELKFGEKLTVDNNLESFELYYTVNHLSSRESSDIMLTGLENRTRHEMQFSCRDNFLFVRGITGASWNPSISDVSGRTYHDLDFNNFVKTGKMDISSLSSGVYFLKLNVEGRSVIKTFVVH